MHLVAMDEAILDDWMLREASLLPEVSVDECPEQVQIAFGFTHDRSRIACTLFVFGIAQLIFERKYCCQEWCEVLTKRICPFIEINPVTIPNDNTASTGVNFARLNIG